MPKLFKQKKRISEAKKKTKTYKVRNIQFTNYSTKSATLTTVKNACMAW